MLTLLAAVTLAAAPPTIVTPRVFIADDAAGPACKSNGRYEIADRALLYRHDGRLRAVPMTELPKANHEKAVLRTVDGCAAPVVVGYQVGR